MTPKVTEKKAAAHGFRISTPDRSLAARNRMTRTDRKVLFGVMAIAVLVRLYNLGWPNAVVFDEVHFGGFARKYILGTSFFDVHPPLAKMLFGVVGWLGGYDGDFTFEKIGKSYVGESVPYVTMRMLPSMLGLLTIALCFATMRASGVRTWIAAASALLLTFENTHATESRYILLDAPLVFFIALTAYNFTKFELQIPFSRNWFRYLLLTGLGLGATVSSKWVGLFTIAWVGLLTLWQLWWIYGDLTVPLPSFAKHFGWRAVFLIAVPALFYMSMFWLHFFCLDNDGEGADFLPRAYQAHLKHNKIPADIPADVFLGSEVSIRHLNTAGGYLHSHAHMYETGSKQQQVTLYPHIDENNLWIIQNGTETNDTTAVLRDGDIVRFFHPVTSHRLHSHDHRPPVSNVDYLFEVSGYGHEDFEGDINDNWRVKIVDKKSHGEGKDHVQALRTVFQLEHTMSGCLLYSKKQKLPEWGFGQQEVSCIRSGRMPNTLWYIEHNTPPEGVEVTEKVSYPKMSFLSKFLAVQKVMWRVNKGLTDSHPWESRPESWPILRRGINMWGGFHRQVYLTGNLPVYWATTAFIVCFTLYKLVQVLVWQRRNGTTKAIGGSQGAAAEQGEASSSSSRPNTPEKAQDGSAGASHDAVIAGCPHVATFDAHFGRYLLGWALHYFPSYLMVRQLFLHHYLASVYFGVLAVGQTMEFIVSVTKPRALGRGIVVFFTVLSIAWYMWYSPLVYGTKWTKDRCEKSLYLDMDFECKLFLPSAADYVEFDKTGLSPDAPTPTANIGVPPPQQEQVQQPLGQAEPQAEGQAEGQADQQQQQQQQQEEQHGMLVEQNPDQQPAQGLMAQVEADLSQKAESDEDLQSLLAEAEALLDV